MELEEAIKILRKCNELIYSWNLKEKCDLNEAIEKVLQALEKLQQDNYKLDRENQQLFESKINSISKKKIEDSIKFLTSRDNFDFVGTEWRESEVVDFLKQLLEG